jgi:outer membrane protein
MSASRAAALLAASWLALVPAARAQGLIDTWQAAERHDAEHAVARASHQTAQARGRQARTLWSPSVALTATAGWGRSDTTIEGARFSAPGFGTIDGANFETSIGSGTLGRFAVTARQPLYNRELSAQARQVETSVAVADARWEAARQDLMLRTAQRWIDAAMSAEALRVATAQQEAVDRALREATDRYRLGDAPVTGTHEARARAEAVRAQVLAARTDLDLAEAALADLTGRRQSAPRLAPTAAPAPDDPVAPLQQWLDEIDARSPAVRARREAVEIARAEVDKSSRAFAPTVDLVAQVGRDRLSGSGDYGSATNSAGAALVGVQLSVPLFTGGAREARNDEALRLIEQTEAELEQTRQAVSRQARAAWLALSAGDGRVAALRQSLEASRARLASTRTGQRVGDRTTLDVLNAENDTAQAELDLVRARLALQVERLRLAALVGRLDPPMLAQAERAVGARD